jgi:hypothetical protein
LDYFTGDSISEVYFMADPKKAKDKNTDAGSDAWEAIAVFEQILAAIPNDSDTLATLTHAYEMVGDHTRAREYLIRLANVLMDKGDTESVGMLIEKLKSFVGEGDASAQATVLRFEEMGAALGTVAEPIPVKAGVEVAPAERAVVSRASVAAKRASTVSDELAFAWHLHQSNFLTQEEYAKVAQDLTEVSTSAAEVTVSVLHVLNDRGFRNLESVITFACRETNTPPILLSSFELVRDTQAMLPLDYCIRRGVLVFELMGTNALVTVLNPYNKALRQEVQSLVSRPCYFFVAMPGDFDLVIGKIKDKGKEGAAAKPA